MLDHMGISIPRPRMRTLRWVVPVAVVAGIALIGSGVFAAGASPELPNLTAAQLLVAVEQSHVDGFSGQVVENASLGLPQLPSLGNGPSSTSLIELLSGSHTSRVWYAGPTKQRFALLGTLGETDVFHDGTQLWQWDSDTQTASHTTLPAADAKSVPVPVQSTTLTPQQLAQRALAAIDPSTIVSTDQPRRVAGRDAYDLVLSPRDSTSLIGSVRIAIDSTYKLPLSVQVFSRGATSPSIDISFTSISFAVPSNSEFSFTPPKSATVRQEGLADALDGRLPGDGHHDRRGERAVPVPGTSTGTSTASPGTPIAPPSSGSGEPHVLGQGWTSVLELSGSVPGGSNDPQTQALVGALTPVSGSWGSGKLFSSKLVTALFTNDGRIFVGAVAPAVLYADAAAHR
jgi:outer membrane lipoprotein-sorting protein